MRYTGELVALATAACWATGFNLFAAAGTRMGSQNLNRLRMLAAVVLLSLSLLVTRGSVWPTWATPNQVIVLALSGVIGFVLGDAFGFKSLVILGPGRGALLAGTAPLFTAVLAWPILGERPGPMAWLGMLLTVSGVMIVTSAPRAATSEHHEGSTALGITAGVVGAIGQAGGFVLSKIAIRTGIDPLSATVIRAVAGALGIWGIAGATGVTRSTFAGLQDRRATLQMLSGSVFGPFLGVTLSLLALRFIETGVAASIIAVHPLFAMLLAARFHGERITARTSLGALIAVVGIVVLFRR